MYDAVHHLFKGPKMSAPPEEKNIKAALNRKADVPLLLMPNG
jgi:hypothetical protein